MNQTPIRLRRSAAAVAVCAILAGSGCNSGDILDEECNDCGPCGFVGGPNETDTINYTAPGLDASNTPAVDVVLARTGECVNQNGERHRLRWTGTIDEAVVANVADLDTSVAEQQSTGSGKATYQFYYSDLVVTTQREGPAAVTVTFSEGALGSASMHCSLDANTNATMSCVDVTE